MRRPAPAILTAAYLRRRRACPKQVARFEAEWPDGCDPSDLNVCLRADALHLDLRWAAAALLTGPARQAYREADASACRAYQEATAPARRAYYQEAGASAERAYREVVDLALRAYEEARAPAFHLAWLIDHPVAVAS